MRSNLFASTLAIALGVASPIVGAIGFPEIMAAQVVDQRKVEADRLFKQGDDQYRKLFEEGNDQYKEKQFKFVIQLWQQSLKLYREVKNQKNELKVLKKLGANYQSHQYEKSIDYQEQALALAREIKDEDTEIELLKSLARSYQNISKYARAIEYSDSLLKIINNSKYS